MNENFAAFVAMARRMAEGRGLRWDLPLEEDGSICEGHAWDLSAAVGDPPPRALLSDLGSDAKCLAHLDSKPPRKRPRAKRPLSPAWQDFVKSVAIDQVLLRRNSPVAAIGNVVRPARVLATCAEGVEPWELTPETIRKALEVAASIQPCGALGRLVEGVVRGSIDRNLLADRSPLLPPSAFHSGRRKNELVGASTPALRRRLADRKAAEKLPTSRALWELVRIVFTEKPRTFMDVLRFAQVKLLLLCGFRIGEVCMVLADWMREREYFDLSGRPAGEASGISSSLMIRHFAEKQRGPTEDGVVLYESVQHVPEMFRGILTDTLEQIRAVTGPLRSRLKAQTESGRLLPEYTQQDLIPAMEFFNRLSGYLQVKEEPLPSELVEAYRTTWSTRALEELRAHQRRSPSPYAMTIRSRWSKWKRSGPPARKACGALWSRAERLCWEAVFFRVHECEELVARAVPTKMPDLTPFRLADGRVLYPHELLFLGPKRSLIEQRNGGICDVGMYCSVGRLEPMDLELHLGGNPEISLFERYGQTAEDGALSLNSHSLRHLQHTELFRLGIADTIIAKRFSPAGGVRQRYVYDHRTLAEELDAMDLPPGAENQLGTAAQQTLKMFASGRVRGPIVEEFERIQRQEGDDAAFEYLKTDADGFHATPYGFCLANFTVDPCQKHLECFNGCRYLTLSPEEEHRRNLELMRGRLRAALTEIEALPVGGTGRENQLKHTKVRLANIERALCALPGSRPFAEEKDCSDPI